MPRLRTTIALGDAVGRIHDADLLLWRPRTVAERLTALAGRGQFCHAAMAAWWGAELMCLQSRLRGIEAVTLRSQVEQSPGLIDVFASNRHWQVSGEFQPSGAVAAMRTKTGRRYGSWNLLRTAMTHAVFVRLFIRADASDNGADHDNRGPEFCSQAVASATRLGGGVDPVPQLRDRFTEPDDLARSAFYQYRFTLVP